MDQAPVTAELRERLLAWYDRHKRDLPWRRSRDPYAVWVSEVMLQQTRVQTAIPYYERWMKRFPDVQSLAIASPDEVLREWTGLGYYRRALNLQKAAVVVVERHGGGLPSSVDELRALPGVGEYTAGAVASMAFERIAPAVDANARRVLARLHDLPDPTRSELRHLAVRFVDPVRPGEFNQALMELGARLCTPGNPTCGECPLANRCRARLHGTVAERPARRRSRPVASVRLQVTVALTETEDTFLVRRPDGGLLGGMWEFPSAERSEELDMAEVSCRALRLRAGVGRSQVLSCQPLEPVRHRFSHLEAVYEPVLVRVRGGPREGPSGSSGPSPGREGERACQWVALRRLDEVALPVAQRKIAAQAEDAIRR